MARNDDISVGTVRRDVANIFGVSITRTFFTFMELQSIPELRDPEMRDLIYRTVRQDKSVGKFDDVCAFLHKDDPTQWGIRVGRLLRDVAQRLTDMELLFPCG